MLLSCLDQLGETARRLLGEMLRDESLVSRKRADIKARTEELRPMLREVRDAFNRGETVNGFTTWTDWGTATGYTMRRLQQIIREPKPQGDPPSPPQDPKEETRNVSRPTADDPFSEDKAKGIFDRETPIPLPKLADDLMRVADELRCAHCLDGFADPIDVIAERIQDREELDKRMEHLNTTWPKNPDGSYRPRNADYIMKHLRRDRRYQEDMKLIIKAGGTTYRGKKIMGGPSFQDPYIYRYTRKEIKAEVKNDLLNQLGVTNPPEELEYAHPSGVDKEQREPES